MIHTFAEAKAANRELGHYWFSPDTMRFFGTKLDQIYPTPAGAVFTHISRNAPSGPEYKVAVILDSGEVNPSSLDPWGDLPTGSFPSLAAARLKAQDMAARLREVREGDAR